MSQQVFQSNFAVANLILTFKQAVRIKQRAKPEQNRVVRKPQLQLFVKTPEPRQVDRTVEISMDGVISVAVLEFKHFQVAMLANAL